MLKFPCVQYSALVIIYSLEQLTRLSQDLLQAVASNCTTQTPEDTKVIECIVGLKLKTKQLVNHHFSCVRYVHQDVIQQ